MKISMKEKVSYGIGAVGKDMVYMLVNSFVLFYYNSVLGVSSAFIGGVLMGARVFDAFNDPFMGIVVAKTKSRWGKFRPWIFSGTVLNAVVMYALFAVPQSMEHGTLKGYLIIIYLLWGITYTLMDIPYWSMIPAITEPGRDRENLSSMARSCAGFGSAIPTILTMVLVPVLGAGTAMSNYRIGFRYWALIIAVVFVVSEFICCKNVKDKSAVNVEAHTVKSMFKALFSNDQALTTVITIVLVNTSLYITSNLIIYYFTYIIGDGNDAYSIFSAFGGAAQILAMVCFPLFRNHFDKKRLFIHAIVYEILGYLLLLIFAFTGLVSKSWMVLFLPGFLIFLGSGLLNVLVTIFLSDSVDYGEMKQGSREESVIFSMQTFVVKLASGVAALLAGVSIDLIGLNVNAGINQTQTTITGLNLVMTILPITGLVIAIVYFLKHYTLDDDALARITRELKERKNQNDSSAA